MKALVTGASSGIGKEIAIYLSSFGYDLYVVSRNEDELKKVFQKCQTKVICIEKDLSSYQDCYSLYEELKDENIDILVNNAGFGDAGNFIEMSLEKELKMIDVNVRAYHILTKLFLKDFTKRNYGRILNVASIAGFFPGPYMATYYATKAYILNLSLAIYEELIRDSSKVHICVFCPGPVRTNFNKRANVRFKVGSISAKKAAHIAVDGMFLNHFIIVPNNMKLSRFLVRIAPVKLVLLVNSMLQRRAIFKKG